MVIGFRFIRDTSMETAMTASTFSLLLLAAFVVCEPSIPDESYYNSSSLEEIYDSKELAMEFLERNILSETDSTDHYFCDDPYAALCGIETKKYTRPIYLKQAYPRIRNHLINILGQPIEDGEVKALATEKILFTRCMNVGSKDGSTNAYETSQFVQNILEIEFDGTRRWQEIDDLLYQRGFDRAFFHIGVERNPENPKQNIIVLQPTPNSKLNDLMDAFDKVATQPMVKGLAWRFFDNVDVRSVKLFFNDLKKIYSQSSTQRKQEKMTLKGWTDEYNKISNEASTNDINWLKLVGYTFSPVGIDVLESENIIVRNKDYFLALPGLLSQTKNDVIVGAIKMKLLLDNIRYIDHPYAESLRHRKKTLFCFSDTNLYGASFRLLRDLKKDDSNNALNYEILDTMLRNIADVFQFAIEDSNHLTSKEKTYLRAQVKLITWNGVKHNKYRRIVDDYYEDYKVQPSYFASIVNYRKKLKDKKLGSLVRTSERLTESEPFSVIDLAKPRNRFILNVLANSFLLTKLPIPSGLQKEVHYGVYGTKVASFLYGLLNENKFDNVNLTGRVNWYDRPEYPATSLRCFIGEDIRSYGWTLAFQTVTQIFGAHIAYSAMLKDYSESGVKRPEEFLLSTLDSGMIPLAADQLFFLSYGKYQCDLGQMALKTILLNLDKYKSAFECESKHGDFAPRCPLNGFQIQKRGYFVNQPF